MPTITRTSEGYVLGDIMLKRVVNLNDMMQSPGSNERFLTADGDKLRAAFCKVTHDESETIQPRFLATSDCAFYVWSGEGEFFTKENWAKVGAGDLVYAKAGELHCFRVTQPGQELWYLSVAGPVPVAFGDQSGKLFGVALAGPKELTPS